MQDGVRHELRGGDRDPVQAGVRVQVQARLQDGLQEVLHHRARRGVQVGSWWCGVFAYGVGIDIFRFYNPNIFRISYATSFKTVYDKKCSTHYEKSCHDVGYGYHKERQGASLIRLHYLQIVDTTDNPVLRRRSARATRRRAVMTWLRRFHLHIQRKFATKSPNRNVTVCLSKFQRREGSEIVSSHISTTDTVHNCTY